ncbi:hypothetical protein GCM10022251_49800 [Phytohabitans flavus]|uniref:Ricin B lectin domain-containing protein n=1 Tax=Phytohabitans flavus TaxID=1076124 RepID=A0A6F8XSG1_9ACTN|nr:RICIN domain-containing protein [Phytohabitans flavus]BCB76756.1 hypothetical protein Pflav_031660 [Phytohabitans flavus]
MRRLGQLLAVAALSVALVGLGAPAQAESRGTSGPSATTAAAAQLAAVPPCESPWGCFGPFQIRNFYTNKCVDLPNLDGGWLDAPVTQYDCRYGGADNQMWYRDPHPNETYLFTIRNAKQLNGTNVCLDLPGYGTVSPGTPVSEFTCQLTHGDNQLWYFTTTATGLEYIVNNKSGLCLDVSGYRSTANDTRLTVFTCSLQDDHFWYFH